MKTKTYSANYLANEFDIDRATAVRVLKSVEADEETTKGRPTFTTATFAAALELHHLSNASNNGGGTDGASDTSMLTAARVRIANANAEAKERQNKIASGEFLPALDIADALTPVFVTMREIALSLPGKIADALAGYCTETVTKALATGRLTPDSLESCRGIVYEIIRREVHENLTNLSSPESYIEAYRALGNGRVPVDASTDEVATDVQ